MERQITYSAALLEAHDQLLESDPNVYIMGLGVPDPKGHFGTTLGLQQKYGNKRVMDMPTSENAMTGIAIGSAIRGMRPIMTHQRVDFFLLALDQLINNAAKWHYMFGGKSSVPLVIRLIIGRGWGQGPQHSQTLHSLFAHIPGLKVVMPSTAYDAKGLLIAASQDNNPVVFIEHRWLHNTLSYVPKEMYTCPIGKANIVQKGSDVTLVCISHMTLEAVKAAKLLENEDISIEIIDVRSLKPLDTESILTSIKKTGRLIVVDPDWKTLGFASEILAIAAEEAFFDLKAKPIRITYPDSLTPTSWKLANDFYPTSKDIARAILKIVGHPTKACKLLEKLLQLEENIPLDQPDKSFIGPF